MTIHHYELWLTTATLLTFSILLAKLIQIRFFIDKRPVNTYYAEKTHKVTNYIKVLN